MDSKQILTLNKRQSIVQRIDAMKASFSANKIKDKLSRYHYFGYPSQLLVDKLISKIPSNTVDKNSAIAVVNDFGLEVISQLQALGYTNLILLCTESDDKLYNIIKYMVEKEFNFNKIVRLEESMEDKFDLVIANPPYEIGNAVIIETMKHCEEAVVLMPVSQLKSKDLYKKINSMSEGLLWSDYCPFSDATVTVNIMSMSSKNKNNYSSILDCLIQNKAFKNFSEYISSIMNSSYKFNIIRGAQGSEIEDLVKDFKHNFFIPTFSFKVYRSGNTYSCNKLNSNKQLIDFIEKNNKLKKGSGSTMYTVSSLSESERNNLVAWWYNTSILDQVLPFILESPLQPYDLIPRIDWSRTDVDYTDDYVLSQMGLKWNENKDGVEKL